MENSIVIGVIISCLALLVVFLHHRNLRAKSVKQEFAMGDNCRATTNALPEMDDRFKHRPMMRQSTPEIRLFPADGATVTSPSRHLSSRPNKSIGSRTTAANTNGTSHDLRVTTENGESTFGSVKGKGKVKVRQINSEAQISAATTLVSSSASSSAVSHWERPVLVHFDPDSTRRTSRLRFVL